MLAELHEAHCLTKLSRISPLEYDDPLDRVIAERHGIPVEKVVAPKALDAYLDERRHKDWPLPKLVSTESDRLVGRVAPQERDTIRDIFRRKTSLGHVVAALSNLPEQAQLHARAVNDMAQAITEFQQWWNTMARNYAWRSERACQQWRIDFETCEIFLEG
jgi:CXXX repeat modification system protein